MAGTGAPAGAGAGVGSVLSKPLFQQSGKTQTLAELLAAVAAGLETEVQGLGFDLGVGCVSSAWFSTPQAQAQSQAQSQAQAQAQAQPSISWIQNGLNDSASYNPWSALLTRGENKGEMNALTTALLTGLPLVVEELRTGAGAGAGAGLSDIAGEVVKPVGAGAGTGAGAGAGTGTGASSPFEPAMQRSVLSEFSRLLYAAGEGGGGAGVRFFPLRSALLPAGSVVVPISLVSSGSGSGPSFDSVAPSSRGTGTGTGTDTDTDTDSTTSLPKALVLVFRRHNNLEPNQAQAQAQVPTNATSIETTSGSAFLLPHPHPHLHPLPHSLTSTARTAAALHLGSTLSSSLLQTLAHRAHTTHTQSLALSKATRMASRVRLQSAFQGLRLHAALSKLAVAEAGCDELQAVRRKFESGQQALADWAEMARGLNGATAGGAGAGGVGGGVGGGGGSVAGGEGGGGLQYGVAGIWSRAARVLASLLSAQVTVLGVGLCVELVQTGDVVELAPGPPSLGRNAGAGVGAGVGAGAGAGAGGAGVNYVGGYISDATITGTPQAGLLDGRRGGGAGVRDYWDYSAGAESVFGSGTGTGSGFGTGTGAEGGLSWVGRPVSQMGGEIAGVVTELLRAGPYRAVSASSHMRLHRVRQGAGTGAGAGAGAGAGFGYDDDEYEDGVETWLIPVRTSLATLAVLRVTVVIPHSATASASASASAAAAGSPTRIRFAFDAGDGNGNDDGDQDQDQDQDQITSPLTITTPTPVAGAGSGARLRLSSSLSSLRSQGPSLSRSSGPGRRHDDLSVTSTATSPSPSSRTASAQLIALNYAEMLAPLLSIASAIDTNKVRLVPRVRMDGSSAKLTPTILCANTK